MCGRGIELICLLWLDLWVPRKRGQQEKAGSRRQRSMVTSSATQWDRNTHSHPHTFTHSHTRIHTLRHSLKYASKTPTPPVPNLLHKAMSSESTLGPNTHSHILHSHTWPSHEGCCQETVWGPMFPYAPWLFRGGPMVGSGDGGLILHRTPGLPPAPYHPGERKPQLSASQLTS